MQGNLVTIFFGTPCIYYLSIASCPFIDIILVENFSKNLEICNIANKFWSPKISMTHKIMKTILVTVSYRKRLNKLNVIIVIKLYDILHQVYGNTKAVPSIWNNHLFHVQYIICNIFLNVKECISKFCDQQTKLGGNRLAQIIFKYTLYLLSRLLLLVQPKFNSISNTTGNIYITMK